MITLPIGTIIELHTGERGSIIEVGDGYYISQGVPNRPKKITHYDIKYILHKV